MDTHICRAGVIAVFLSVRSFAGVTYVDGGATQSPHDGSSWCRAYLALDAALVAASSGTTIRVADGVYTPSTAGLADPRTATFRLRTGVVVEGGYAGCGSPSPDTRNLLLYTTTLNGDLNANDVSPFINYDDNVYHVVTYDDPNATGVVLDGFTVSGGNANGPNGPTNQGGGIHIRQGLVKCLPGGPTIRNCIVEKNWGAHHGAINDHGLSTVIENCTIRYNYAGVEGGGLQIHSGAPTVTNCLFLGNESGGEGGGSWAGTDTDVTCSGPRRPDFRNCTFDGNQAGKGGGLFISNGSGPTVTDCTFVRNRAVFVADFAGGGGVYNRVGVGVSFRDCVFSENVSSQYAAAMANHTSSPDIIGCDFVNNRGDKAENTVGGGIVNFSGASPWIEDCVFQGNTATIGAAITNDENCFPVIVNSLFADNASPGGGVVFNPPGNGSTIFNSVFRNNFGGGIYNFDAALTVVGCVFTGNVGVADNGGAIGAIGLSDVLLVNSTLHGNSSQGFGGAISLGQYEGSGPAAVATIHNSILWNNSSSAGTGETGQIGIGNGSTATLAHTCLQGWTGSLGGTGNTGSNPMFLDADGPDNVTGTADDNLRLVAVSPLINQGDNLLLPADFADLDGDGDVSEPLPLDADLNPRVTGAAVDMGAYETTGSAGCRPGTFSATGAAPCVPCAPGFAQPNWGATQCLGCGPGTYQPASGATTCLACSCDDAVLCTINECNAVSGVCRYTPSDALCSTGQFCHGERCDAALGCINDHECIGTTGNPCPSPDTCDETTDTCGGCLAPTVQAAGSRYIRVTPGNQGNIGIAIKVVGDCNDAQSSCVASYVQSKCDGGSNDGNDCDTDEACPKTCSALSGNAGAPCTMNSQCTFGTCQGKCDPGILGPIPYYKASAQWGTILVRGAQIRPGERFRVHTECNLPPPTLSAASEATTWIWGDTSGEGDVDALDLVRLIDAFRGIFGGGTTFEQVNHWGCTPDKSIDALDIALGVEAYKGFPYPCGVSCP